MTKIDDDQNEPELTEAQLQELARKDAYARIAISKWLSHLAIQIETGLVDAFDFRWSAQSLELRPTGDVMVDSRMMLIPLPEYVPAAEAAQAQAQAQAQAEAAQAEAAAVSGAGEALKNLLAPFRDYLRSVPVPTTGVESDAEKFRKFVETRAPIIVEELCEDPDCTTCQARRSRSS